MELADETSSGTMPPRNKVKNGNQCFAFIRAGFEGKLIVKTYVVQNVMTIRVFVSIVVF